MAKVVLDEQRILVQPWWAKGKIAYASALMGLAWWIVAAFLTQYVINPLACRDLSSAETCANSVSVGGNIALILVAVLGTLILVRLLQPRPIIVAISTTIILWNLAGISEGLAWYWTLLCGVLLFAISYALFALVVRVKSLTASIIIALIITIGTRLLLAL